VPIVGGCDKKKEPGAPAPRAASLPGGASKIGAKGTGLAYNKVVKPSRAAGLALGRARITLVRTSGGINYGQG
jgi:hypothetical protein